ncbi:MAG: phenylalanine--tRNA ligase subunit alpha, partial [Verrucomicrobia bacterium]|nr:phenylalanine--tRNA ligase subunit alpha [Verrucomicrobiota bacterium]
MNLQELNQIRETALAEARGAADATALEAVRIKYLGRNGLLPEVMAQLKEVPNEEKPAFGKGANALKNELAELIKERQDTFSSGAKKADAFDPTLPGLWPELGSEHPISKVTARIVEIFQSIGFTVA